MDKLYIPGDLVYIHGSLRIVSNCDGYYATYYDENESLQEVNVNVIEGIPITPEILEKNGWKVSSECRWIYVKEDNVKIFRLFDDIHYAAYIGFVRLLGFQHIHQLQHLLFGLGINHEMEV